MANLNKISYQELENLDDLLRILYFSFWVFQIDRLGDSEIGIEAIHEVEELRLEIRTIMFFRLDHNMF